MQLTNETAYRVPARPAASALVGSRGLPRARDARSGTRAAMDDGVPPLTPAGWMRAGHAHWAPGLTVVFRPVLPR